ncbi:MAG: AAA family ATPase [Acidobacteria bacterium]|nr:AAA family ATPase [Acidobacteriota bacterium]
MYKEFYGLRDYPFNITPDPGYIVFNSQYKELLARLHYSIEMAKGLTVLIGEVGTGKTTALRWILRQMESTVLPVYIFNPCISVDEFYHQLDETLKIGDWTNKSGLLMKLGKMLENRHNLGLRTVLIIDEAHQLSDRLLEEIRLLMNFESDSAKHLQIILSGQPELTDKLNQTHLRQLKQRITLHCRLGALESVRQVDDYITERLLLAGSVQPNVFSQDAIELIFQCSEGIPRQINNLCDNAMLTAYEKNTWKIGREIVADVARGLSLLREKEPAAPVRNGLELNRENRFLTSAGIDQLLSELDSKWRVPTITDMPPDFRPSE